MTCLEPCGKLRRLSIPQRAPIGHAANPNDGNASNDRIE
jgi:hypothetical protein